ncbi:MAG: S1-like domain-containing RNA-binding protein [Cellulosilyticaceae bacterium]
MIELGKIQTLEVTRRSDFGVYLNSKEDPDEDDILLPRKQVPEDIEIGSDIEVFVYRDSEDRLIATTQTPKLTIGKVASLTVVETTKIGAFLDWGLAKDLLLPFREQVGDVAKGSTCLVGIYIDKSDRICATMKIYDLLQCKAPYEVNQRAKGIIYNITEDNGAFVAVDNQYHGLIPVRELLGQYKTGDAVEVRVKSVRADGKLELSLRKQTFNQIEDDAQKIMAKLKANDGKLPVNDSSTPDRIKIELSMSKASFKRAVGRLMKQGAIKITDTGIQLNW